MTKRVVGSPEEGYNHYFKMYLWAIISDINYMLHFEKHHILEGGSYFAGLSMKISCGIWPICQPPQNEIQQVFPCLPFYLSLSFNSYIRSVTEVKLLRE